MKAITPDQWNNVRTDLDAHGFARIGSVLDQDECRQIIAYYEDDKLFRSTVDMKRYRFGLGEYKYFSYPLPSLVQSLREKFYTPLVPLANGWMERLGAGVHYPDRLHEFLAVCHSRKQERPTPLVLRYDKEGFNTLHQDIYGDVFFPFQVVFMLTQPGRDFVGGELVFVEQVPRAQSRAEVVTPAQGDAVAFTTNFRPVKGSRGYYRARMKHGVSPLKAGRRFTMGLIFHDAS